MFSILVLEDRMHNTYGKTSLNYDDLLEAFCNMLVYFGPKAAQMPQTASLSNYRITLGRHAPNVQSWCYF